MAKLDLTVSEPQSGTTRIDFDAAKWKKDDWKQKDAAKGQHVLVWKITGAEGVRDYTVKLDSDVKIYFERAPKTKEEIESGKVYYADDSNGVYAKEHKGRTNNKGKSDGTWRFEIR